MANVTSPRGCMKLSNVKGYREDYNPTLKNVP